MTGDRVRERAWRLHVRCLTEARPLAALARRWAGRRDLVWLDSSQLHPERARFSALCRMGATALALGRSSEKEAREPCFVARAREAFERSRTGRLGLREEHPSAPFLGGWVGYLAYEAQIDIDAAFPGRPGVLPYPRSWFREARSGVTVDHAKAVTWLWAWTRGNEPEPGFDAWERVLDCAEPGVPEAVRGEWAVTSPPSLRARYEEAVRNVLERIRAGEVYQVNLTTPVPVARGLDPLEAYSRLRRVSPGDFAAYLCWPGLTVLSSSPEQLFSLASGRVVSRPMKGTRPRGNGSVADQAYRVELGESAKDRAENVMIVDLVRNDLGRVAEVGTVEVTRLFEIETYATVHQLTSRVEARLARGEDVFSLIAALFPPGSMTGTPKVQATRVIRELEPGPRGLYSGCLGAIDWSGDAVFNVVIRSLVVDTTSASWAVGGGIVADSDPSAEYEEAMLKLAGLERALGGLG